jgi:hypothetical protein
VTLSLREQGSASLSPGDRATLKPISEFGAKPYTEDEERSLSEIIKAFNERHGTQFTREDFIRFEQVNRNIVDKDMAQMLRNNPPDVVYAAFSEAFFKGAIDLFQRDNEMKNIVLTDAQCENRRSGISSTEHFGRCARTRLPNVSVLIRAPSPAALLTGPTQIPVQFLQPQFFLVFTDFFALTSRRRYFLVLEPQHRERLIPTRKVPCFLKQHAAALPIFKPDIRIDCLRPVRRVAGTNSLRQRTAGYVETKLNPCVCIAQRIGSGGVPDFALLREDKRARRANYGRKRRAGSCCGSLKPPGQILHSSESDRHFFRFFLKEPVREE